MAMRNLNGHPADHELLLAGDAEERGEGRTPVGRHLAGCSACRARLDLLDVTLRDAANEYRRLSILDEPPIDAADCAPWTSAALSRRESASASAVSASLAVQRARLEQTLVSMPVPRASWWRPTSIGLLPPWAGAAAAVVVVISLVAPSATWLAQRVAAGETPSSLARGLPAAELTPGAIAPVSVRDLCEGRIPSRVVSAEVRDTVLREYGMQDTPVDAYELDALITPELGGTTDAGNLWPQRYTSLVWHARIKDVLEERLAADVCAGRLDLKSAQRDLAKDWVAAYRRYFQTDAPLQAHLDQRLDEREPELEFAAPRAPRLAAYAEAMALVVAPGAQRPRAVAR